MATPVRTNLDLENSAKIINVPTPTAAGDVANKSYVDNLVEGLNWKANVRVASTGNVNISTAPAAVDGVTLSNDDRVLLKNQSTGAENGVYIFNGSGSAMTRSGDVSTAAELVNAVVTVSEGTTNADTTWRQDTINITLGTTSISWVSFGSSAGAATESSAGIAEIATQAETDTGTDDARFVTPLKLTTWSGATKRFQATIGDGTSTQLDVTHNRNSTDIIIQVFIVSSGMQIICDITRLNANTARFNFASAPASNTLRVVVLG